MTKEVENEREEVEEVVDTENEYVSKTDFDTLKQSVDKISNDLGIVAKSVRDMKKEIKDNFKVEVNEPGIEKDVKISRDEMVEKLKEEFFNE